MNRNLKGGEGIEWRQEGRGWRLEMLTFEGDNPDNWIFWAEGYFTINQLSDDEKIESIALCFEAGALAWFQWDSRPRGIHSWERLKQGIMNRFRPNQEGSLEERFLAL